SVCSGSSDVGSSGNTKHEIRNPKQYPMIQIRMIKTESLLFNLRIMVYPFEHLNFKFILNLEFLSINIT
ncbi:MAG: hypothetical protein QNK29_03785, partial [Desulfobacterales bacterium]|nr:hypothetical protein [Desulfobacterales bacterium]MDX2511097.1 hypothetical protein [Desulfobacterales bacterium]